MAIVTGSSRSKGNAVLRFQAVKTGLQQYFAKKVLLIDGKPYKAEDLETLLQNQIDALQQVDATHGAWMTAVGVARTGNSPAELLVNGIRAYVTPVLGSNSEALKVFGFTPRRKPQASAEAKAQAVHQMRATRKARNTMGKKQRQSIKGVVPASAGPAVTPSTTSTSSPSPAVTTPTSNGVGGTH
jgi:hypothetical protein